LGHQYRVAERNGEFSYLFNVDQDISEIFLELKFIAEDVGKSITLRINDETEGEQMITVPEVLEKGLFSEKLVIENKWKKDVIKLTFMAPKGEESCRLFGITLRNS